jgi:hypothetical protein
LQRLCRHVDLLGMEMTRLVGFYQLNGILESCRLVKSVPKGFFDQRAGRCMVPALTSMNFCEQLATFLPGDAPHLDTIGATPVEIPFYQHVSLSQTGNPISGSHVVRKDVVLQGRPDLRDPCIRTSLSFWILRAGMHGVSCDAYNPWRAPWYQGRRAHQL